MGQVVVVAEQDQVALGVALGEASDGVQEWLGVGRVDLGRLRLVVARDVPAFRRWTRGMAPDWSAGVAWPSQRTIVIRVNAGEPFQTLRHELAHLALHQSVAVRVPRWFDEGYAVVASGEQGRLAGLRLNLAVALGRVPTLRELDAALVGGPGVGDAYALAGSAVGTLMRLHPSGQLESFIEALRTSADFGAALQAAGYAEGQFERDWHRLLRRQYNLGIWLLTGGAWVVLALLLGAGVAWRRYQDAPRRAALNVGWTLPDAEDDIDMTTSHQSGETLDPTASRD